jgi:hypothetical protein
VRVRTHYRTTFEQVNALMEEARIFEDDRGITERWKIGSQEFQEGLRNVAIHQYRQALSDLEQLVVKRLLELTKLNLGGIGKSF